MQSFKQNEHCLLNTTVRRGDVEWVKQNTAILVVHGIGNQLPMETVDQFGRGLVKQYRKELKDDLKLTHEFINPKEVNGTMWFDNMLRITNKNSDYHIDVYEYYWAELTPGVASWKDMNSWLQDVVSGAEKLYKENATLGKQYKDRSIFFDTKTGAFLGGRYRLVLTVAAKLFLALDMTYRFFIWAVGLIPFMGKIADSLLENYTENAVHAVVNVISEVAIYNTLDPKSKFYTIRDKIAAGAVSAVQSLLEKAKIGKKDAEYDPETETYPPGAELAYPSVIIAGHSLGSQVSFDAINRINLYINKGEIKTYDKQGNCKVNPEMKIADQLRGFITFGCPLDKIFFFLRENVQKDYYIRQQFVRHYYCFKQRESDEEFNNSHTNKAYVAVTSDNVRHLDSVQWRNYFDDKDYVSGGLDYYYELTNINCQFEAGKLGFTHSDYWTCDNFYIDIISHYLND